MPTRYEPGDYIKVEFLEEVTGIAEWMWVRVHRCDETNRMIFGTLENTPLNAYDDKLTLGGELAISFDQIREHKKSAEFESRN